MRQPPVRWRANSSKGSIPSSRRLPPSLLLLLLVASASAATAAAFVLPLPPSSSRRLPLVAAPCGAAGPFPSSSPLHSLRKRRIRLPRPPSSSANDDDTSELPPSVRGGGGSGSQGDDDSKPRRRQLLPSLRGPTANEHDADIWRLSGPALLTLVVDPALSIVDTAYVGRLGATALASLGPCTSIFHLSFNGFRSFSQSTATLTSQSLALGKRERVRGVVLQALALSLGLGAAVVYFLRLEGRWALAAMGAPVGSVLSVTGLPYLRARALAAPAVLMLMVCEGTYRGFGDTMTPLPIAMSVALVNLILDPLLIFAKGQGGIFGWGVRGAAYATVMAQYVGLVAYFALLFGHRKSPLNPNAGSGSKEDASSTATAAVAATASRLRRDEEAERARRLTAQRGAKAAGAKAAGGVGGRLKAAKDALPTFALLLSANAAMLVRNGTLMLVWALCTATATRMSTQDVAAHQVALSVWLLAALVSEAPGIAAQVLAARYHAMKKGRALRSLARRLAELGLGLGSALGVALALSRHWLPKLFASDPAVLARLSQLMLVLGFQLPLVALTLIGESFLVGCGKFTQLGITSALASGACAAVLLSLRRIVGPGATVVHIWWVIKGLFVTRLAMVALLAFNPWDGPLTMERRQRQRQQQQRLAALRVEEEADGAAEAAAAEAAARAAKVLIVE